MTKLVLNAQKLVHLVMAGLICFITVMGVLTIYYVHSNTNSKQICKAEDFLHNYKVEKDYLKTAKVRICFAALVELYLIGSTCFTLRLLNGFSREYAKEIFRVKLIYITFIISYSTLIVYNIVWLIIFFVKDYTPNHFIDTMMTIWLPFIWDLTPILVVLILHSRILYWTYKQRKLQEQTAASSEQEAADDTRRSIHNKRKKAHNKIKISTVASDPQRSSKRSELIAGEEEELLTRSSADENEETIPLRLLEVFTYRSLNDSNDTNTELKFAPQDSE